MIMVYCTIIGHVSAGIVIVNCVKKCAAEKGSIFYE